MADPLVVIPARLGASRLPGKVLADIHGRPMIAHVLARAIEAGIGPVVIATDSQEVARAVEVAGGRSIMTRGDHPSGSDRVHEAVEALDPEGRFDVIVNLQGDLPTIDPASLAAVAEPLLDPAVDIATLACVIAREEERGDPNVVKLVGSPIAGRRLRALYFTRATAPSGPGPLLHHVGVYAWRRRALARFVALPPSPLERRERLEQLRALEAGMRIDATIVDAVPLGVDAPRDLERAREMLAPARSGPGSP